MTEGEIKKTYLYQYCLNRCESEELKLSLASELKYAFEKYKNKDNLGFDWTTDLWGAFTWRQSPQGTLFWSDINCGIAPEGYK